MLAATDEGGRVRRHLIALLLQSRIAAGAAREADADAALVQALEEGRSGGFLRSFVDEGRDVVSRTARLAAALAPTRPELAAYAGTIVSSPASGAPGEETLSRPPVAGLTDRETELLALVAEGMSNRDIATTLALSETTVKWHLKNIFGKLSVTNRVQAVRAARIGLGGG